MDTKPADRPEDARPDGEEADTEGHYLPNFEVSRQVAAQRERDIQRGLQRHEHELEARRPHRKER